MKEIFSTAASVIAGLGLYPQRWSKESTISKRKIVSEEIHHIEEIRCIATAVGQRKPSVGVRKADLLHVVTLSRKN